MLLKLTLAINIILSLEKLANKIHENNISEEINIHSLEVFAQKTY